MIRLATIDDSRALATIHSEGWLAAYPHIFPPEAFTYRTVDVREAEFREAFDVPAPEDRIWVSERNGVVAGFAYTRPGTDSDIPAGGELKLFYVSPELKGGGIGLPLFEHAIGDLRDRGYSPYLYTLEQNHLARAWYERRGWHADGATVPWSAQYPDILEVRYRPAEWTIRTSRGDSRYRR